MSVSIENDMVSTAWEPTRFQPYQKAAVREGTRRIREEKREAHSFGKTQIQEFLTTVRLPSKKPLPTKSKALSKNTWSTFDDRNRGLETRVSKTPQSAKVREGSAKGNAKVKTAPAMAFTKLRSPRSSAKVREGKREGGNMNVKTLQSAKVP